MGQNFSPVTIVNLREHFRVTYKLNEEQIDLMVVSSARSLQSAFLASEDIQESDEDICVKITAIAHSLKGLLLNMGQYEWAGYAREIEYAAKAGEKREFIQMIQKLRLGMQEVSRILTVI
jgi:hypothetical protein